MRLIRISILLSLICLAIALIINIQMAIEYSNATGKTRALYGLTNLHRLYYSIIGIIGFILSIISIVKNRKALINYLAALLAISSVYITLSDLWKVFI